MSEREPILPPKPHLLPGEDFPSWLAASFALIGMLIAAGAAWLWMTERFLLQSSDVNMIVAETASVENKPDAGTKTELALPSSTLSNQEAPPESGEKPNGQEFVPPVAAKGMVPYDTHLQNAPAETLPEVKPSSQKEDRPRCPPVVTILFRRGSATPKQQDQAVLLDLQQMLSQHPQSYVVVEGHADSIGTPDYNLLLSYWRAKAVVALLKKAGIRDEQVRIRAAGVEALKVGVPTNSGENRRVTLQLEGVDNCSATESESVRR